MYWFECVEKKAINCFPLTKSLLNKITPSFKKDSEKYSGVSSSVEKFF